MREIQSCEPAEVDGGGVSCFDADAARGGFRLPVGFWRVALDAPAGVWTSGRLFWGEAGRWSALAVDSVLYVLAVRPVTAQFQLDRGERLLLKLHNLGAGEGVLRFGGAVARGVRSSPRRGLAMLRRGVFEGVWATPDWAGLPEESFDPLPSTGAVYLSRSDDVDAVRPMAKPDERTPVGEIPDDGVVLFCPVETLAGPGCIRRIAEGLGTAAAVSWDERIDGGARSDVLVKPSRPMLSADGFDLIGQAWAARGGALKDALAAANGDIAIAKRQLAAGAHGKWVHLFETLSRAKRGDTAAHDVVRAVSDAEEVDVSVIIPTRDRPELLEACLEGLARSAPRPRQVIIVDHETKDPKASALISAAGEAGAVVVRASGPFNFSALVNLGAAKADGRFLCLLNNDVTPISTDWLGAMLEEAERQGVGAVGAELRFADGRLQHAGLVCSEAMGLQHAGAGRRAEDRGPGGILNHPRETLAVTAACLLTPRAAFEQLGGFDETYPADFNDVDYCLRVREAGLSVVWTPYATLTHQEGESRGRNAPQDAERLDRLMARHPVLADVDAYFSPRNEPFPPDWGLRKLRP